MFLAVHNFSSAFQALRGKTSFLMGLALACACVCMYERFNGTVCSGMSRGV